MNLSLFKSIVSPLSQAFRDDLEGRTMKAARKGEGAERPLIFDLPVESMDPITAVFYGSRGAISQSANLGYSWDEVELAANGHMQFTEARKHKDPNPTRQAWTDDPVQSDYSLVAWLIKGGYLQVQELAATRKGVPPAISVSLFNPATGKHSAFVWKKDMGGDHVGFSTVLYPAYVYEPSTGEGRVMSPLEHLSLYVTRHYGCSCNITTLGYVSAIFKGGGAYALESCLKKFVELFGDVVPSTITDGRHTPYKNAKFFASRTVVVDHSSFPSFMGKETSIDVMMRITAQASKAFGGIHYPSTGSRPSLRKHFLAGENRFPEFCSGMSEAHRPGRNRSLLVRTLRTSNMKVALVVTDSLQCYITPTGIEKSKPEIDTFLPQVSFEPVENWPMLELSSWSGKTTTVWVSPNPKQESKRVGKLLDQEGSRFEPREVGQWTTEDGTPIDVLYSTAEAEDKKLMAFFLSKATPQTIIGPKGEQIKTYVFDHHLFRSGVASENIQPRFLKQWTVESFTGKLLACVLQDEDLRFTTRNNFQMLRAKALYESAELLAHQPEGTEVELLKELPSDLSDEQLQDEDTHEALTVPIGEIVGIEVL